MNVKKIITLLLAFALTLSLAACGGKDNGKGDSDTQGATAEEIYAQIQELADKENAIMEENLELWQKLFAAMNEKRDEIPDESNYGAYLLAALDLVKDQFTEDELKTLTEGSEQIRDLEDQIQPLQEQYAALQPAGDGENGDMSAAVPTFPTFTGKDLDGNDVDSSIRAALGKLFSWKLCVLITVVVLSVIFYRPFCKWLCPLGAFYALFNRVSLLSMHVDESKCVSCGKCARTCPMDVDVTKTPNHSECIRCGKCVTACPTEAVRFRYAFGSGGACSKLSQKPIIEENKGE